MSSSKVLSITRVPKVVLVICLNLDGWHKKDDAPFISYIIWNNKMLDDPDHMTVLRILRHYPNRELVEVRRTCYHCRKRGAK